MFTALRGEVFVCILSSAPLSTWGSNSQENFSVNWENLTLYSFLTWSPCSINSLSWSWFVAGYIVTNGQKKLLYFYWFLCLISDKNDQVSIWFSTQTPIFSDVYRKSVQMTVLCSNHPSSFALKQPVTSPFVVCSHKNIHSHSHISPPAGGKIKMTHAHTASTGSHFYHILLEDNTLSLNQEKKSFTDHLSSLSPCRLSVISGREIIRRGVLDLSYRQCEWGTWRLQNQWKTLDIQPAWSHFHTHH